MYGTHTLAFQRIFVRMKIISLIFIRFSYVSFIRNSVTGPYDAIRGTGYCKSLRNFASRVTGGLARNPPHRQQTLTN
jgi:hypothetical protein